MRRRIAVGIAIVGCVLVGIVARPIYHLVNTAFHDERNQFHVPSGYTDDASRMDYTRIAERFVVPSTPESAERQLAGLLQRAQRDGLHVSIAGAQHSMGAHSITRDGILIDMTSFRGMSISADSSYVTVRAGTRWADLIPYLDPYRRSVAIMQSNNDFTNDYGKSLRWDLEQRLSATPGHRYVSRNQILNVSPDFFAKPIS